MPPLPPEGDVLPEKMGGVCGPLAKTLTLFMTRPAFDTLFMTIVVSINAVDIINLRRAIFDGLMDNDKKVASCKIILNPI